MAKCELLAALEEAKAKGSLLEISDEFLLNLVHSALSFDNPELQKEEVAAVKWATKYEVHNLAAKHQMIPYILFDFIFDAIEHQNLLKKNIEKQEK